MAKDIPSNAVLATDIKYIKDSLTKIEQKLEDIFSGFIRREEVAALKCVADKLHEDHEMRLRRIERWGSIAIGGAYAAQIFADYFLR